MKRTESLAAHALLAIARQRSGFDAERCRLVLEHLDTSAAVHTAIHQALAPHRLSELQFAVLVVLFSLDPDPIGSADLAMHTAVSRSAITEALDHLEKRTFVTRTRDTHDRRMIYVRLAAAGRKAVEPATLGFLQAVQSITRLIDTKVRQDLFTGCALLQEGAITTQS
ncbi:MAG: MarR family transcriptional regulator [Candidatus Didemnitutus sp.]|nr:MarR family transcriptional regulator [Candidatus Didemnitutus sp.]